MKKFVLNVQMNEGKGQEVNFFPLLFEKKWVRKHFGIATHLPEKFSPKVRCD
jgi:hypothetical protein